MGYHHQILPVQFLFQLADKNEEKKFNQSSSLIVKFIKNIEGRFVANLIAYN